MQTVQLNIAALPSPLRAEAERAMRAIAQGWPPPQWQRLAAAPVPIAREAVHAWVKEVAPELEPSEPLSKAA